MENIAVKERVALGDKNFLKIVPKQNEMLINYELQMIAGNKIPTFLEMSRRQNNDEIALMYNITNMRSLSEITAERKLTLQEFKNLLRAAGEAEMNGRAYQLANKGLVMSLDYIFVENRSSDIYFVYLPIYEEDTNARELGDLVKQLILNGRVEASNDSFISRTIDLVNKPDFSYSDVRDFVKERPPVSDRSRESRPAPKPISDSREKQYHADERRREEYAPIPPKPKELDEELVYKEKNIPKKKGSSPKNFIFILAAGVMVVILAMLYTTGVFIENGQLRADYLGAAVLICGCALFILYRELFVNKKKNGQAADNAKKKKIESGDKKKPPIGKMPTMPNKPVMPNKPPVQRNKPVSEKKPLPEKKPIPSKPPIKAEKLPKKAQPPEPPQKPERPVQVCSRPEPGSEDTEVMDSVNDSGAYLEYFDNGIQQKLNINKSSIILGKQKSRVDYDFHENTVSKVHAEICSDSNGYYIKDCHSTNGTYINGGSRLIPEQLYQIYDGDTIRIAKIELIFHC